MGKNEKRAYLKEIKSRYSKANKEYKARILDEFCQVCHYNRKYAIRLLSKKIQQTPKKAGRKPVYSDPKLIEAIETIWLSADQPCSRRLKALLPLWVPFLDHIVHDIPEAVFSLLGCISSSTIDRILKASRVKHPKGLSGTKPGTLLKSQIQIRTGPWDISGPGFMEADTVAHCGNSMEGDFVWSLTMTDIYSGWTECRATWNKGSIGVRKQVESIEKMIPFKLLGFDSDNGSEFLNYHLLRYFSNHPGKPSFTRSRPYKKNDNAHVEQKNWSHVRQLFGYDRFSDPQLVDMMNDLYSNEWSQLQNFFMPSFKLKEKCRIGGRYQKRYFDPETPCQRLLDCPSVPDETKRELIRIRSSLNPFELRSIIDRKLKDIFKHVSVTSNVRQRI